MPKNALEIGFGDRPAVEQGDIFRGGDYNYIGIELPKTHRASHMWKTVEGFPRVTGSMHTMPFADASFDLVLMRSVFGQFNSQKESILPTRLGILECQRILRPGGQIVVTEENTPWPLEEVSYDLEYAGFALGACIKMPTIWEDVPVDDEWLNCRQKYYSDRPVMGPREWYTDPYILTAVKPEGLDLTEFDRPVSGTYGTRDRSTFDMVYQIPRDKLK